MDWEKKIKEAKKIYNEIAKELVEFGGILVCKECGQTIVLNEENTAKYLGYGWPMCCGYTMRWFTKNELESE